MQTTIPTLGPIFWMRRRMPGAIALGFLLVFGFAQTATAQTVAAASDPPLDFGNNFFVTGDYVVAGAQGLNANFANGFATGTISIPDANPGIRPGASNTCIINGISKTNCVPAGAQIVAALLYWQTVEKLAQPGSGQNGFFRPKFTGGPPTGYPITGVNLNRHITVSFGSGGCTGTSTGKVLRTYRADVLGLLPQDSSGNVVVNGTYEVRLPGTGNTTPIALGATLVVIYRILSPSIPLNSIVIYDGAFAQGNTLLTMTQPIQGFYQAGVNPVSRLTHIVGSGQSNKFQTVKLNNTPLPSLYGTGQPAFPGYYGTWDNPTWTFPDSKFPAIANPVLANDALATAQVVPSTSNQGCVSWGAVIVSTTVDDDRDAILKAWKAQGGYTDVGTGQFVPLTYPGDPDPPKSGQRDVFIQLDHVVDSNGDFAPNPDALTLVQNAFLAHNIHLHINPPNMIQPVHAIQPQACSDIIGPPLQLCPYPNQSVTTFRAGFSFLKNLPLNYPDETSCETLTPPGGTPGSGPACIRRFPPAQKDSYRYVVFGDALGAVNWTLGNGTLVSVVASSGNTLTFTTSTPHELLGQGNLNPIDPYCGPNGRVSIVDAISNPNLNGTYCISEIPDTTHFRILNTKATNATRFTDPNLAVFAGHANKRSGESDLAGSGALVTLGNWGPDGKKAKQQAGTLMHELGHLFGLPHGGYYFDTPGSPYVPTYEPNCKPNYQSVMSYSNQVDLFQKLVNNVLVSVPDFSGQELIDLTESSLSAVSPLTAKDGSLAAYSITRWYTPVRPLAGDSAQRYCDGTPRPATNFPTMYRLEGPPALINVPNSGFVWSNNQDIDFDPNGSPSGKLRGFNDWLNLDLRQIGATASAYVVMGGFPTGGGGFPTGGGGFPTGGGGFPTGGGGFPTGGGGFPTGGGGFPTGGGTAGDITLETANSVTRPPSNLMVTSEGVSPRKITLTWTEPTFGQIGAYNVYRSRNGAPFTIVNPPHTVTGNPPATTFTDTVTCDAGGYRYFVTAVLADSSTNPGQESVPSNTVSTIPPSPDPLTGCYILTGFTSPTAGATFTQGDSISTTWTLQDDFYTPNNPVTNKNANTVLAIGPIPHVGACPLAVPSGTTSTPLVTNGIVNPLYSASTSFDVINGLFTINWNTTPFNAGCYFLELDLDSGQVRQTGPFELRIFVSDTAPYITTTSLPPAVVGIPYSNTLHEAGGIGALTWSIVSSSPGPLPGISLDSASGVLSGTPTASGDFAFMVRVTDSVLNFGTQNLTLHVATPGGLVYAANCTGTCGSGVGTGNVSAYIIDAATGALIPVSGSPFAAGISPFWVTVDPAARFAYVANLGNTISAYSIDATTGALIPVSGSPFSSDGNNPSSVAVDPTGQFLYSTNQSSGNVSGFSINGATGALTPVPGSPFAARSFPFSVAVDTTGQFAYVANLISNNISAYAINRTTGALTPAPGSPFAAGTTPFVIVVDPAAPFAYVANGGGNTITAYSIDATTGALTPVSGSPFATGVGTGPHSVNVDPTGQFLYTTNESSGNVSGFSINGTTGALTPVPGSPFAAGSHPISVAVDTTGQFAYVANASSNNISAYAINRTTGALAPAPGSPFAAGTVPASVATTSYACAAFPAGIVPFTTIFSIATDSAGDTFVVGGRPAGGLVSALSSVQLPSVSNERFCNPVTLETNYTVPAYVPTAAERTGDYSAYAGLTLIDPQTHAQFPNNMIPIDRLDSVFAWRIPPHSSSLTRLPCSLEPTLHSIVGTAVATSIQFANDTSGPVNVYWINYQGQRVFYRGGPFPPLAAGQSYVQGTFITHPWIVTDVATNSCLGIWLPTESLGTAVITGSAPTPAPPQPATNLSAAVQQPGGPGTAASVVLTWNASPSNNLAGYNVYRATASAGPYTKLTSVPTANLTFTDTTVISGQTYYYFVTAVDANSLESAYSNQASAVIP